MVTQNVSRTRTTVFRVQRASATYGSWHTINYAGYTAFDGAWQSMQDALAADAEKADTTPHIYRIVEVETTERINVMSTGHTQASRSLSLDDTAPLPF